MHSFGAVFAEVRVDADLGIVRVPRIVATLRRRHAAQRQDRAQPAASAASSGASAWRCSRKPCSIRATAASSTRNLAEYHVPVNADIGEIDVAFVARDATRLQSARRAGIGEIGITGVPAAIANAVFNATGKRMRDLPITLDKLL